MAQARPLLMDKQWEIIQRKTFTKWVNSHMVKRGSTVTELTEDFKDGLKLIDFFEIISNKYIGVKFEKKPRMRIQMIQNVSSALKFLADQKVKLVSISAEDIVDGNLKLILGMIWTIILRFQIEDISVEELSSRDALLLWCKRKTEGYKDCKVDNFHISWQDGMAFCAIIHKHRPDLINYDSLDKNNARENLKLAFDVAEKEFGIPQLLDLEDIVDIPKPDERSIITYVSQYYHYFSAGRKQEVAGRRIGKLVDMTTSVDQLKSDYTDRANKLAEWTKGKTHDLQDHNFPNEGLDGVKNLIQQFIDYKENEKPDKAAEKLALEVLFNSIAMKLRANNRSAFVPPEGTSPSDIQKLWESLLGAERDRDDALRKELERQERLDLLNRRFNQKADKLDAWIAAKDKYLAKEETVDSLTSANERIKFHATFYDEYASSKPRVQELEDIVKELAALGARDISAVQERVHTTKTKWGNLQGSADKKKQDLQNKLVIEQKKEELRIDFAKLAKEYNRWATSTIDGVNDHTFGESLEDVQAYKAEMEKNDQELTAASKERVGKLHSVWEEMQKHGITDLKYTVLTIKDIDARHGQIEESLKKRHIAYEEELKRQFLLEEKRKEFALLAQAFIDHLAARKEALGKLEGEPEPLAEAVKQHYDEGAQEKEKLQQIDLLSTGLSELGINENKHTEYTPSVLRNRFTQLGNYVRNYIQALNEERDLKALYASKAKEILDWVHETIPTLKERGFDNTLAGAQTKSAEFQQYKTGPKAEFAAKKPEIERLFSSISALLNKSHRPEFQPPSGLALHDIDVHWKVLEDEEKKKEEDLVKELHRQEHLAVLVRRFVSDASDLESWAEEKAKYLETREEIPTLFKAQFTIKLFEAYSTEFHNRQPRLKQLEELKGQIAADNYVDSATIAARFEGVQKKLKDLEHQAAEKNSYLHAQLEEQQKNENLRFEFARLAKEFNAWVKSSIEAIEDHNFGFTLEAVTAHKQELEKGDAEYNAAADEKQEAINAVVQELQHRGVTDGSKQSQFSVEDIAGFRKQLSDALSKRQAAHAEELKRQSAAEDLRKVFAGKAQTFVSFLSEEKTALEALVGDVEEKVHKIKSTHNEGAKGKEHIDEISTLSNQMKSEGIYGNSHTKHTVPGLISRNNHHNLQVGSMLVALQEEKELQERIAAQEVELKESEKKENLVIQFSAKARAFNGWIEASDETLNDPINCAFVEDAEKLIAELTTVETEIKAKEKDHAELVALTQEMKSLNVNDFSGTSVEELNERFEALKSTAAERKNALNHELEVQKKNDASCQTFAQKATAFSNWLHSQKEQLAASKGDLEQQLEALQQHRVGYESKSKDFKELEDLNKHIEAAGVKRNKHTDLSVRTLQSEYEQLGAAMAKQETLLTNEIMSKKNADVSPEQVNEFKEVFKHFDKNRDGGLGRLELKACLQALGDEPSESELDAIMKELDPSNQGVSFPAFASLMVKRNKDTDSKDEILIAFKELANDKDFVTEEDLRKVMTNDRVAYLLQRMPQYKEGPGYDYKAWVEIAYK